MRHILAAAAVATVALVLPVAARGTLVSSANIREVLFKNVACPSETQCTATALGNGDAPGGEVTFNPTAPGTLAMTTIDSGNVLLDVACPSTKQCTAGDFSGNETTFDPLLPEALTRAKIDETGEGIACPSESQCTVVGYDGEEVTFDPSSPNDARSAVINGGHKDNVLYSVACPSLGQCTATNYNGEEITFDPTAPDASTRYEIDPTQELTEVACPSTNQCTAVAGGGLAITFDPSVPADAITTTFSVEKGLSAVACPSPDECTAVGGKDEVTFNPNVPLEATIVDIGTTGYFAPLDGLKGVACPSLEQCTAVSEGGYEDTFDPLTLKEEKAASLGSTPSTTSSPSGGSSPPSTASSAHSGSASVVTSAELRSLLAADLVLLPGKAKIAAVLLHGGATIAFKSLESGVAVIDWYARSSDNDGSGKGHRASPLIATGRLDFSRAETATMKLRLTSSGRRILTHVHRLKLIARGFFTPRFGATVKATRDFLLG